MEFYTLVDPLFEPGEEKPAQSKARLGTIQSGKSTIVSDRFEVSTMHASYQNHIPRTILDQFSI
jgi:hypothetical protein